MRRSSSVARRAGEASRLAGLILLTVALSACGEGGVRDWLLGPSSSTTVVDEAPLPQPSPSPTPTPRPIAPATPPPTPAPTGGGFFPNNNSPVVAAHAKVFFLECGGIPVVGSEYASSSPVDCRVHLDVTPRDARNQHTRAAGEPHWTVDGSAKLNNPTSYTPVLTARAPGTAVARCYIDGVVSNDVVVTFY